MAGLNSSREWAQMTNLPSRLKNESQNERPMVGRASLTKSTRLAAARVGVLGWVVLTGADALAQNVAVHVDGVFYEGAQAFVLGWACQPGNKTSVEVRIYAGAPKGAFAVAGRADFESDPGVSNACRDREGKHRFKLALPSSMFAKGSQRKAFAEAMPPSGPPPSLGGAYKHPTTHPWVFTTASELEELARRINVSGSYSAARFGQLAAQIARDLAARNDWNAVFTGCDAGLLQYAFSYEPQTSPIAQALHSALNLGPDAVVPAGAAVVASRLSLYAALAKAGAKISAGGPDPDQAAALAKRILLTWGERGFRDGQGRFLTKQNQLCDANGGHADVAGAGLAISRGIVYSVHAQDLLMYYGALTAGEAAALNAFHSAIFVLLLDSLNSNYEHHAWACDHYGNHSANILAGLMATARLADNQRQIEAVLFGKDPSMRVALPWIAYFDRAIYGEADLPNSCYFNSGADSNSSHLFFSTPNVAPGEIDDRFRNKGEGQGIGYPMFTLERLVNVAEILRVAGFDAYGYRGIHQQSIEVAIGYYACFGKAAGFGKLVSAANSRSCPNAPQYYGKIVNDVDRMAQLGAYRFPSDAAITSVEAAAKKSTSEAVTTFSTDAILFGKWRD
jgi:hypothetical protein